MAFTKVSPTRSSRDPENLGAISTDPSDSYLDSGFRLTQLGWATQRTLGRDGGPTWGDKEPAASARDSGASWTKVSPPKSSRDP